MSARRPRIPAKQRIYVGCEGASEHGYWQMIALHLRDAQRPFHLDVVELAAGAPGPRIVEAARSARRRAEQHGTYVRRLIVMDTDQIGGGGPSRADFDRQASAAGFRIVWQEPCHEAYLLRHFRDSARLRPQASDEALRRLLGVWPGYRKGADARTLVRQFTLDQIRSAASTDPLMQDILRSLGL